MKPRILVDIIKGRGISPFRGFEKIVDLDKSKSIFIPLKPITLFFLVLAVTFSFIFNFTAVPGDDAFIFRHFDVSQAASNDENEEKRKVLEEELDKYEQQISEYEATISNLKKEGKTLSGEISKLNAQIAKLNLQVKATTLQLGKLDEEIAKTQNKIEGTEKDIEYNKKNLEAIIQNIYKNEDRGLVEVFLVHPRLSDFFSDLNSLIVVQENLRSVLENIVSLRDKLIDEKDNLANERDDISSLKKYQDQQKFSVQKTQADKNNLLKTTKGKESEYQKILTETKKSAAEIRKQIFKILGGGELSFEDAYQLAQFAEKAIGVRSALILAVLDRESALGKNVGQCDYKTVMHPKRDIPAFLEIIKELGLTSNLESGIIKVSCANSDGAYGGAMGPAQFIPSTWKMYKNYIAEVTGNNPPSPWRNADAFVATALYLKDAGAANNEKIAAAKYYCGAKWNRYVCTNVYGKKVVDQANKFQDDIDILNS